MKHPAAKRRPALSRKAALLPLLTAGFAPGGHAQIAATTAQSSPEIVVTARQREELLSDVPIQITVFDSEEIEAAGITTTEDYVNLVPNVTFDDSFTYLNSFVVVRGIAQINNADSPLGIVVDGVPQNSQKQLKSNLFDIERIEVLRGPQGALYGRNATGGAINIVTRQPSNDFEGSLTGRFGNGDAFETWGSISGPVVEDVALFRLAAFYRQDDGRIENDFLGQNVDFVDHDYNLRGRLLLTPAEAVTIDLRAAYNDFDAGSIYDSVVFSGDPNDFERPSSNLLGRTFGDITELTGKIEAVLGFATLTAITGYTDITEAYRGDLDFTNSINNPGGFLGFLGPAGQAQDLSIELLSQEIRLTSPDDQPFRWILGGFYLETDRALRTRGFVDLDGTLGQVDNPALLFIDLNETNDNRAWSIFGQADFDVTDRFTISAALRYDEDRRRQQDVTLGGNRRATFSDLQPKLTLSYDLADDRLLYVSYGEGFRSGGFNAPGIPRFEAETVQTLEAGFNSYWRDIGLRLNGAIYYSFVDDFQYFFVDAAAGAAQVISNIDEVEIYGIELAADMEVSDGLRLFGALGTTNSEIVENQAFPDTVGNRTPKTTRWTANAGISVTRPIGAGLNFVGRADYEHRGRKYWQIDNADIQSPLNLVNLRAGIESENWGVYAWGRNVTNERYYTDFNPREFTGTQIDIGFPAQPARYGVEARLRF
ncbi:TonB-dependent receptor [Parasphingopyxis algicola]|uniref:TonB-dependent receptor n=1 Tax=Parasphingopyxis algicola TaxID=2026624 RepID=UPI0015A316D8|nr:TonB-dependent receptor [Parasphingopyxis algicola]QLC24886.1 TonB-dependent receptor [Parasphingopyxis algicola]